MTELIYEIIKDGKHLHKYTMWHRGILQGWAIGESPDVICEYHNWNVEDCVFEREPFSFWEYDNAEVVRGSERKWD